MKTLLNKSISIFLVLMMGVALTMSYAGPTKKDSVKKTKVNGIIIDEATYDQLEADLLDELYFEETSKTIEVYDLNDNLIYKATIDNEEEIKDEKLQKLIMNSDFLLNINRISYYRLNKI